MQARDIMSARVVTVGLATAVREIARLLLDKYITAMPVVDQNGAPIGMIGEGDLIASDNATREARRDWWLALLAEGEPLSPAFLEWLQSQRHTAGYLMSKPVISVDEDADCPRHSTTARRSSYKTGAGRPKWPCGGYCTARRPLAGLIPEQSA